jgi:hypothetical protein
MNSHISDRSLYDHLTGLRKLTDEELSHLAACKKCLELMRVVENLKKYIELAEGTDKEN